MRPENPRITRALSPGWPTETQSDLGPCLGPVGVSATYPGTIEEESSRDTTYATPFRRFVRLKRFLPSAWHPKICLTGPYMYRHSSSTERLILLLHLQPLVIVRHSPSTRSFLHCWYTARVSQQKSLTVIRTH